MKDIETLTSLEQVKALADPLRMRMVEIFCTGAFTTKQIAERLEEKVTKLYHHVDTLERTGIVELVETRKNRGTVEKYYRSVARAFTVSEELFDVGGDMPADLEDIMGVFTSVLQSTEADVRRSFAAGAMKDFAQTDAALARLQVHGSREEIKAFTEKVKALIETARKMDASDGEHRCGFLLALYPSALSDTEEDV